MGSHIPTVYTHCLDKFDCIISVSDFPFQVLKEKNKGTTLGYIGTRKCTNDCPESCTHWYIWNTDMWEQDQTLTVQCADG